MPIKTAEKWTLFRPLFDNFLTIFMKNRDFSHFRYFSELSALRVAKTSLDSEVSHILKWEKSMFFTRSKCGPQGGAKSVKKWSLTNPYPIPEAHAKMTKPEVRRIPGKTHFSAKQWKSGVLALFRTFLCPGSFDISDRLRGWFWRKVSILTRINGVFHWFSLIFCLKGPRKPHGICQKCPKCVKIWQFYEKLSIYQRGIVGLPKGLCQKPPMTRKKRQNHHWVLKCHKTTTES